MHYLNSDNQNNLSSLSQNELRLVISSEAEINLDFQVRIVSSCLIASLGLISNNGAVIIGGMLLAPLMLPLRGIALGSLEGNLELIGKSFQTIVLGTVIAWFLALVAARLYGLETIDLESIEIFSRTRPEINDLCIAIIAGAVGGYAAVNPKFSDTVAGTAIAVALMPPICVAGLTAAKGEWILCSGALLLYLANICGLTFACILAFWFAGPFMINPRSRKTALYAFSLILIVLFIPLSASLSRLTEIQKIKQEIGFEFNSTNIVESNNLTLIGLNPTWGTDLPKMELEVRAKEKVSTDRIQDIIRQASASTQLISSNQESEDENFSASDKSDKKEVTKKKVNQALLNSYPLTPHQLGLIEKHLEERLNRQYKLSALLEMVQEIESEPPKE